MAKKPKSSPVYVQSSAFQIVFARPKADGTLENFTSAGPCEYSREGFAKAFDEAEANRKKIAAGKEEVK